MDLSIRTLRTKIAFVLIVTIVVLLMAATLLRTMQERSAFLAEQTGRGLFVAEALAELVVREGGLRQPGRVQQLVADYGKTAGVVSIRVVDREFTILAAVQFENLGRTYRNPDIVEAVRHGTTAAEVRQASGPSVLSVVAPIREASRLIGAVEVGIDLSAQQADLRDNIQRGILVAMAVAGMATLLLLWALTLVVVRPITEFAVLSQDLARGNFDVEIPVRSSDEIGQLGRALVRMRDSLSELSTLWKDQSPLTGLPGNMAIQRELRQSLDAGRRCVVLYADLDTFKAFNDRYGFERGDQMIKFTAKVFEESLRSHGGEGDFLGHVGGDDFVLLAESHRAQAIAAEAVRRFDVGVASFYDEEDRRLGYIETRDRRGHVVRIPLTSLSVVGVPLGGRTLNFLTIGETVADLKAYAKRSPGSKFVMDRRGTTSNSPAVKEG